MLGSHCKQLGAPVGLRFRMRILSNDPLLCGEVRGDERLKDRITLPSTSPLNEGMDTFWSGLGFARRTASVGTFFCAGSWGETPHNPNRPPHYVKVLLVTQRPRLTASPLGKGLPQPWQAGSEQGQKPPRERHRGSPRREERPFTESEQPARVECLSKTDVVLFDSCFSSG